MNCIIVDRKADSPLLEDLVSRCSFLNLVGTFSDSSSACNLLSKQNNIELAFIDLNVAGSDCISSIRSISNPLHIIAVSSSENYAMQAFDQNCIDYLLKPVSYPRFFKAVNKTLKYPAAAESVNSDEREIFIKKNSSFVRLWMKDITYIEALENYIILNTVDDKFTLHFTMKGFESQLPPDLFVRIHRSFIVNKRLIKTINDEFLQINTGTGLKILPVGRVFRNNVCEDLPVLNR
jgi:DNA-binding LytR/AlgR family response regulator